MLGDSRALLGPCKCVIILGIHQHYEDTFSLSLGEDVGSNVKVSKFEFLETCGSLQHTGGGSLKELFYFYPRTGSDGVRFF